MVSSAWTADGSRSEVRFGWAGGGRGRLFQEGDQWVLGVKKRRRSSRGDGLTENILKFIFKVGDEDRAQ